MSITLIQKPKNQINPVYQPCCWVFDSTNNAQTNFLYLVDVYWDSTLQKSFKLPARPDNGYCVFDISRIMQSVVTEDITTASGFIENENSFKCYTLKVGEEYGTVASGFSNLWLSSDVGDYCAFNGDLSREVYLDWDCTEYQLSGTSSKFLTNAPRPQSLHLNQLAWLYFIQDATDVNKMQIKTYDSSGSLIATNNVTITSASGDIHYSFGVGSYQLNNSGLGTIITSSVSYYTCQVLRDSTALSEVFRFNVDEGACRYDTKRIHFLNKLGGYDSFNFTLVSKNNYDVQRAEFTRNKFGFETRATGNYNFYNSSTTDFYDYTLASRGKKVFWQQVGETLKVTSDWISEAEATWLLELVSSRDIYLEYNNELVAVNIKTSTYETKKKENEKLFNIELEFEYSQPKW